MKLQIVVGSGRQDIALGDAKAKFKNPVVEQVGPCPFCGQKSYVVFDKKDSNQITGLMSKQPHQVLNDEQFYQNALLSGGVHPRCFIKVHGLEDCVRC